LDGIAGAGRALVCHKANMACRRSGYTPRRLGMKSGHFKLTHYLAVDALAHVRLRHGAHDDAGDVALRLGVAHRLDQAGAVGTAARLGVVTIFGR